LVNLTVSPNALSQITPSVMMRTSATLRVASGYNGSLSTAACQYEPCAAKRGDRD
jgi:hypothetical protein